MNEEQLKQLFLRFIKDEGSYNAWKYYLEKKNRSLDSVIKACIVVNPWAVGGAIKLSNGQYISTPFYIKSFVMYDIYARCNIPYYNKNFVSKRELFDAQIQKMKL